MVSDVQANTPTESNKWIWVGSVGGILPEFELLAETLEFVIHVPGQKNARSTEHGLWCRVGRYAAHSFQGFGLVPKGFAIRRHKPRLGYMGRRCLCTLLMLTAECILVTGADRSEPIHRSTFVQ